MNGRDAVHRFLDEVFRLASATRDLEREFLVSGDALERLEDLEGFAREDLGLQPLRGRAAAMQVYAVTVKPGP